jgi:hypothetical protein
VGGKCICDPGKTLCNIRGLPYIDRCVDLLTDVEHCSDCNSYVSSAPCPLT